MIKQITIAALAVLMFVGVAASLPQTLVAQPAPIPPQQAQALFIGQPNVGPEATEDFVTITIRALPISGGPGNPGTFLVLPENVTQTPGGGLAVANDLTLVLTDVRITYLNNPSTRLELREQSQTLSVNRLLLTESSMVDGWQSSVGVTFTGDTSVGLGVVLTKADNLDPNPTVDLELVGYVTNR